MQPRFGEARVASEYPHSFNDLTRNVTGPFIDFWRRTSLPVFWHGAMLWFRSSMTAGVATLEPRFVGTGGPRPG